MSLPDLLDALRRSGIRLRVEEGRLKFSAPKGALTDELRARIAAERSALIALLSRQPTAAEAMSGRGEGPAPLSHAQQRLWVVEQIGGLGAAYNIPGAVEIAGRLDGDALARALTAVMRRQASLRTALRLVEGEPHQIVELELDVPLVFEDLTDRADPQGAARDRLTDLAGRPFDLGTAPLFRALLLRLAPERHVFGIVLHHAIADGWSISLLLCELGEAYAVTVAGHVPEEVPVAPSYAQLAAWERSAEGQARIEGQLAFWRERLAGAPELLELPADRPRPAQQSFRGASRTAVLPADTVARLSAVAQAEGASLFMALSAVFAALIGRYSGEEDFLVGTPLAGRDRPETQGLVGLFVNTLPLRCDLSGRPGFRTLLGRTRRTVLDAFDHAEVPFERLVEAVEPARDPRYAPLCQVLFALQSALDERLDLAGATLSPVRLGTETSKVDLFLAAEQRDDGAIGLEAEYCSDLFEAARIERLLDHFVRLAAAAAENPDRPVATLPLLSAAEREALLVERNPPARVLAEPQTLPARFTAVAAACPDTVAVELGEVRLTYRELERAAERLAVTLAAAGVASGDVVGLHLPRCLALPAALLGILRIGAAYLPLDRDLPVARRRALLADADVRVVLSDAVAADELSEDGVQGVDVEAAFEGSDGELALPMPADPDTLAYVMYTSGSTGGPKGVCVTHRNVLRLVEGIAYDGPPPTAALQLSSIAFDASTLEIWTPLLTGARLVIAPPGPIEPASLAQTVERHRVDLLWLTAGLFHRMVESLPDVLAGVRYLLAGGDVVQPQAAQAVLDRMAALGHHGHRLGNGYGPTECTTFTAVHWMRPGERLGATVPIGRPIGNTRAYVVDAEGQLSPDGVPGELWVGGLGVARGYLGRTELTAERFLPDPFAGVGRVYRTGDRVRWLSDGTLEFLGRLDQQLKLRGFRIEPGEIEEVLLGEAGVIQAAVVPQVAASGAKQLVAYLVAGDSAHRPSERGLQRALAERLPAYMVPAHFVFLEALPLNRNGKLDRSALPRPEDGEADTATSRPPEGAVEESLAAIWRDLLKREAVGAEDNFFALGGDSILAMQVVLRAGQAGFAFGLRDLLERQTIAELAVVAARSIDAGASDVPTAETVAGPLPLSPIQRWFFERRLAWPAHWNQAVLLAARAPLSVERLQAGLDHLAQRHEALRQRFPHRASGGQGIIVPETVVPLDVHSPADDREQAALADAVQASLDLAEGPLFRAALFRRSDRGERLLLVAHHLVVDVVSWVLLIDELCQFLDQPERETTPVPVPWSAYAARVPAMARPASAPSEPLPVEQEADENEEATALTVACQLEAERSAAFLGPANEALRSEATELLLAALSAALLDWSGAGAVTIDVERHGRDVLPDLDLSRTVGWFTRLEARRLRRPGTDEPGAWLAAARLAERPGEEGERAEVSLNYLGRVGSSSDAVLVPIDGPAGALYAPGAERVHLLELIAAVEEGQLRLELRYSPARHRKETVARLVEAIADRLRGLVDWTMQPGNGGLLPLDVPLCRLDTIRLDRLLGRIGAQGGRHPARAIETILPLSPQQQGMLFDSLAGTRSGIHHEQLAIRLKGDLDPTALEAAWRQLAGRHPILRTAFFWEDLPQPLQVVFREVRPAWTPFDGVPDEAWLLEDRLKAFDLASPGTFRLALWRAADDDWCLVWTFHHLLLDGWSMALLLRELMMLYEAARGSSPAALSPAVPYGAYVAWLAEQDEATTPAFWRDELGEAPAMPPLDFAPPGAVRDGDPYGERQLDLDVERGLALEGVARRRTVTLGTLLQAAWALLLGGLLRRRELVVGVTTAGRPEALAGSETSAGLFINTLPLRVSLPPEGQLGNWLADLFARHLRVLSHQHVGAGALSRAAGRRAEQPLFEALLVYENYPRDLDLSGVRGGRSRGPTVVEVASCGARTRYPLTLLAVPGEQLRLHLVFDRRRVPDALAERLLALLDRLLEGIASEASLAELTRLVEDAGLPAPRVEDLDEQSSALASTGAGPETPLEQVLVEVWSDLLDRSPIPVDRSFFDLGGHSLLALEMAAAVGRRLGLEVDAGLLFRAPTVRSLAAVLSGLEQSGGTTLVQLAEGEGPPLVVLPGASGNPLAYLPLARHLAGRQVLGVQLSAFTEAGSIEAMAEQLVAELPTGPLHLLGHSFGAALAYETARCLEQAGRTFGAVLLLDLPAPQTSAAANPPSLSEPELLAEIAKAAARYFGRSVTLAASDPEGGDGRCAFLAALADAGLVSKRADGALVDRLLDIYRHSQRSLADWQPGQLRHPVTVLRAADSEATAGMGEALGWTRWTKVARSLEVPGDHIGAIVEPAVERLAETLRAELADSEARWETVASCV